MGAAVRPGSRLRFRYPPDRGVSGRATQEAWHWSDLAAQRESAPVVLFVHDQMRRDIFDRLR